MREFIRRLDTGTLTYDFLGRWRRWYLISAVVLLICLLAPLLRPLNLGIEFRGGADFQAPTQVSAQTVDEVRAAVAATSLPDIDSTQVTTLGDSTVRVQTRTLSVDEVVTVRTAVAEEVGVPSEEVAYSLIGASWGQQVTERGLIALVVFLVLVVLVIWIYFRDWKMSIAALVALLHDLVVTVGVYALSGFTVTPATLIGVLTILGYSLYDTVVVFDKVRENVLGLKDQRRTYTQAANAALNAVLARSINTTIIGVLPVLALLVAGTFVLGQGPLKDLALALFVGMVAGAYSSIFLAAVVLAQLKEREPAMAEHRRAVERRLAKERPRGDRGTARGRQADGSQAGGGSTAVAVLDREDERPEVVLEEGPARPPVQTTVRGPLADGASRRPQPRRSTRDERRRP